MLVISIDGACRRNGQPTCVSASGLYVEVLNEHGDLEKTYTKCHFNPAPSTSQRGEIQAMVMALEEMNNLGWYDGNEHQVITDSSYVCRAMNGQWYRSWQTNGWMTQAETEVKNRDLWERIIELIAELDKRAIEFIVVHIKGHLVSVGERTAAKFLASDASGRFLYNQALTKYNEKVKEKPEIADKAHNTSLEINGYPLSGMTSMLVALNCVADTVAKVCVDNGDSGLPL